MASTPLWLSSLTCSNSSAFHRLQSSNLRLLHFRLETALETRKGARPNKAAWFALTWLDIDHTHGLDIDPALYRRGAYRQPEPRATPLRASLVPLGGAVRASIAPADGARASSSAPADGAVRPLVTPSPAPAGGAYLEKPSAPASAAGMCAGVGVSPSLMAALRRTAASAH